MTAAVAVVAPAPDPRRDHPLRNHPARDHPDVDHPDVDHPDVDHHSPGLPYLTPVPDCEPPFDDERGGSTRPLDEPEAVTAELAASITGSWRRADSGWAGTAHVPERLPSASPSTTRGSIPPVRVTGSARAARTPARGATSRGATAAVSTLVQAPDVPPWSQEADIGVRKTTTADLPAAERSASVLARAVIEVLSGRRPLGQLRVHCAPEVFAGLADRPTVASAALPHLVSVRVCEPADGVAEVSVAYRRAARVRALAFRIQGVDGRWRMTALQLG